MRSDPKGFSEVSAPLTAEAQALGARKETGKKTDNPREGWEDGTPPPHRDVKERGVMR